MSISRISFLLVFLLVPFANAKSDDADFLAKDALSFEATKPADVFKTTFAKLKEIFERYEPGLDSNTKILSGPTIGGTADRPILKVSLEKCVLFICKTVDIDSEVTIHEERGDCQSNLLIEADLTRSSEILSDIYDRLSVSLCFNSQGENGTIAAQAFAHQSPKYSTGIVQSTIADMLRLQVKPIIQAASISLKRNGAR